MRIPKMNAIRHEMYQKMAERLGNTPLIETTPPRLGSRRASTEDLSSKIHKIKTEMREQMTKYLDAIEKEMHQNIAQQMKPTKREIYENIAARLQSRRTTKMGRFQDSNTSKTYPWGRSSKTRSFATISIHESKVTINPDSSNTPVNMREVARLIHNYPLLRVFDFGPNTLPSNHNDIQPFTENLVRRLPLQITVCRDVLDSQNVHKIDHPSDSDLMNKPLCYSSILYTNVVTSRPLPLSCLLVEVKDRRVIIKTKWGETSLSNPEVNKFLNDLRPNPPAEKPSECPGKKVLKLEQASDVIGEILG
ncbi:MAG: hypothetical protein KGJ02_05025 [Verrucomicrobiota bacterium]|nr:hypothetical protein [Verrucomicrobiota bacterium]